MTTTKANIAIAMGNNSNAIKTTNTDNKIRQTFLITNELFSSQTNCLMTSKNCG